MSNNDSFMTVLFAVVLDVFFFSNGRTDNSSNKWNPISATLLTNQLGIPAEIHGHDFTRYRQIHTHTQLMRGHICFMLYSCHIFQRVSNSCLLWPVWDDILTPTIYWPRGQNIVTIYWPPIRYFDLPYNNLWQSFIFILHLLDGIYHLISIILMNF